ncbi:MAG: epoxyqueuosine reductase [Spirochaetes bacterium]|nr:epoxyqueuosine reductase [Spirochaetota bacterium]
MNNPIEAAIEAATAGERCIHGFSDLRGLLPPPYDRYGYGITLAMRLDDDVIDGIREGPTAEYHDHYREVNRRLESAANRIADFMAGLAPSEAVTPTFSDGRLTANYQTLRAPLSHKMAATRSGLGWIGKCDLFVSERFGPRIRLATVLTEYPLEPGEPVTESRCGACTACVRACPAGAPSGRQWRAGLDRDEFFDPFKCREKCLELTERRIGQRISICGICVSVCPQGR